MKSLNRISERTEIGIANLINVSVAILVGQGDLNPGG